MGCCLCVTASMPASRGSAGTLWSRLGTYHGFGSNNRKRAAVVRMTRLAEHASRSMTAYSYSVYLYIVASRHARVISGPRLSVLTQLFLRKSTHHYPSRGSNLTHGRRASRHESREMHTCGAVLYPSEAKHSQSIILGGRLTRS